MKQKEERKMTKPMANNFIQNDEIEKIIIKVIKNRGKEKRVNLDYLD